MNWRDRIEQDPGIMVGQPVIKGTRLTVRMILEKLGAGSSYEDILHSYEPYLSLDDILAAQSYAADHLAPMTADEKKYA